MSNTTEHFHRPTERKLDTKIDLLIPRKDAEIVFNKITSPYIESFEKARYELAKSTFKSTIRALEYLIFLETKIESFEKTRFKLAPEFFNDTINTLNSLQSLKAKSSNIARGFFVGIASLPELIGGIKEDSKLIDAKKDLEESINKNAGRMKR